MWKAYLILLLIGLCSCEDRPTTFKGYCVGKSYIKAHYIDRKHYYMVGKVQYFRTTREKIKSSFSIYVSDTVNVQKFNVDSVSFKNYHEGLRYTIHY